MNDIEQINAYYKKLAEQNKAAQEVENSTEMKKLKAMLAAGILSKVEFKKYAKKYNSHSTNYGGKTQQIGDSAYDVWYGHSLKQAEFLKTAKAQAQTGHPELHVSKEYWKEVADANGDVAAPSTKKYWDAVSKDSNSSIADAQDKAIEDLIYETSAKPKIVSFSNPTSEAYKLWNSVQDQKAAQETWKVEPVPPLVGPSIAPQDNFNDHSSKVYLKYKGKDLSYDIETAQPKGNPVPEYSLNASPANAPMDNEALTKAWNACTKGLNPPHPVNLPVDCLDTTKMDEKTLEKLKSKGWVIMPASKGATITLSTQSLYDIGGSSNFTISKGPGPTPTSKLKPAPTGELVWTYEQAHKVILKLQQDSRSFGYHLCLGGGVLNHGASSKDLDLYFLPLDNDKNIKTNPYTLLHHLRNYTRQTLEPFLNDPRYSDAHVPYIFKGKGEWYGIGALSKRVDFFIMGNTEQLEQVNLYLLESATGGEVFDLPQENLLHSAKEETYDDVL